MYTNEEISLINVYCTSLLIIAFAFSFLRTMIVDMFFAKNHIKSINKKKNVLFCLCDLLNEILSYMCWCMLLRNEEYKIFITSYGVFKIPPIHLSVNQCWAGIATFVIIWLLISIIISLIFYYKTIIINYSRKKSIKIIIRYTLMKFPFCFFIIILSLLDYLSRQ